MTFVDPLTHDPQAFLAPEVPDFPGVLALPERTRVPEGELYTFRFPNGYGALVVRPLGLRSGPVAGGGVFELCVLDCTGPTPQPTFLTPVCDRVQGDLSEEGAAQLLAQTERLPRHPSLVLADEALLHEEF